MNHLKSVEINYQERFLRLKNMKSETQVIVIVDLTMSDPLHR